VSRTFLETIKVVDGEPMHMKYHQKRYTSVVGSYKESKVFDLASYIKAPKEGIFRCRLLYTPKSLLSVSYYPYLKRSVKRLKLIDIGEIEYARKYANREGINQLFNQRGKCDDVLMVQNGFIKETTIANVAFLKEGLWYTPKEPLLKGTTRERLLDEGKIVEAMISKEELFTYEAIALMNAMIDFDIIHNQKLEEIIC